MTTRLTDAKIAVLKTHGICDVSEILDFDEAQSIVYFKDGDEKRLCDCYTRVMGYHRPTSAFNNGKKQEHKDRTYFKESTVDHTRPINKSPSVSFLEGAGHD